MKAINLLSSSIFYVLATFYIKYYNLCTSIFNYTNYFFIDTDIQSKHENKYKSIIYYIFALHNYDKLFLF